ncbi:MAG: hypothetical protein Q9215_007382 [Flavoplaca cf. flavocitrina]
MVICNYALGAGLEARSCFDALAHAPRSAQQEVWLPRQVRPPSPPGTVISPTVVYSNDTKCSVWATLKSNLPHGQASSFNISQAAHAVIMNCVIPRRLGGWVQNIVTSLGGDNKVAVLVKGSTTQAQCGAPVARATERSCGYILDDMIKSADGEDFGRPGSPGKVLPVRTSWIQVWQSAEIITAACVRGGKGGEAPVPALTGSTSGGLKVQILDEPVGEGLLGVGGGNGSVVDGGGSVADA